MHGSAPLHGGSVRKSGGVPQDPFQGPAPPGRVHQGEQGWPGAPQAPQVAPPLTFSNPSTPMWTPLQGGVLGGKQGGRASQGGPGAVAGLRLARGGAGSKGEGHAAWPACMHATLHGSLQGCMPPHPPHPPHPKP